MAATLTYRYTRKRKDGKSTRRFSKGSRICRTRLPDGTYRAVQQSYRIQGKKPNVGGDATDK